MSLFVKFKVLYVYLLDFVITDHIIVTYHGSDAIKAMLDKYYDYVMGEVLGDKLVVDESMSFDDKLNEEDVAIQVERVSIWLKVEKNRDLIFLLINIVM